MSAIAQYETRQLNLDGIPRRAKIILRCHCLEQDRLHGGKHSYVEVVNSWAEEKADVLGRTDRKTLKAVEAEIDSAKPRKRPAKPKAKRASVTSRTGRANFLLGECKHSSGVDFEVAFGKLYDAASADQEGK